MAGLERKPDEASHSGVLHDHELQPGYRDSLDELLRTQICLDCTRPLHASYKDRHVAAVCKGGHEFSIETLVERWAQQRSPVIGRLLRILSLNETWCRGMAGKALQMGLASLAADYHERAAVAEASVTTIRNSMERGRPDED